MKFEQDVKGNFPISGNRPSLADAYGESYPAVVAWSLEAEIVETTLVGSRFSDIRQRNNFVPSRLCQNRFEMRLVYHRLNENDSK